MILKTTVKNTWNSLFNRYDEIIFLEMVKENVGVE